MGRPTHARAYNYTRSARCDLTTGLYNVPIPASPTLDSDSAAIVTELITTWSGWSPLDANGRQASDDYSVPTYVAKATDSLATISQSGVGSVIYAQVQGMQIRVPAAAQPATGTDGHLCIIDENGDWCYEFWSCTSLAGATITCSSAGRFRIRGDGLGKPNSTAANFANTIGLISYRELTSGYVPHAIALMSRTTRSGMTADGFATTKTTSVWPATGAAASGASHAKLGTWLQLNMTPTAIRALGLPKWKTGILIALATYGGVIMDSFGGSSFGLAFRGLCDEDMTAIDTWTQLSAQQSGGWSAGIPSYGDFQSGVAWTSNLRALSPGYMRGLYEARALGKKLDPVSTVSNNWTLTGGASAHICLSEPNATETVANYAPYVASATFRVGDNTNGHVCEVVVATPTIPAGRSLQGIVAWVCCNTPAAGTFTLEVRSGASTSLASATIGSSGAWLLDWYSVAVPAALVASANLADLRIRMTTLNAAGFVNVDAAHIMIEFNN